MAFNEFKETVILETEQASKRIKKDNVSNLFFYFDKNLTSGFVDKYINPKSTSSFDYVIPAVDYFAIKRGWSGRWVDTLGFYDNNYDPSPIVFFIPGLEMEWELLAFKIIFQAGHYKEINTFKFTLKNGNTKEIEVIDCSWIHGDLNKSICILKEKLEEKYKKQATLENAISIAVSAYKDQKNHLGEENILHPLRVMGQGETETEKTCGILHDLVEKTDWTFELLEREGFSEEVISALQHLEKKSKDEDYGEYIDRVLENQIAAKVKLIDLLDNMDITRYKQLNENDLKRLNKYLEAYWKLKEQL